MTDLERVSEERMNKDSFISAIDDERVKMRAEWSAGADQVFNFTEWNINSDHAHLPSSSIHMHTSHHRQFNIDKFNVKCDQGDLALRPERQVALTTKLTTSPAVARMADRTAPVVKLTLTLTQILPGARE